MRLTLALTLVLATSVAAQEPAVESPPPPLGSAPAPAASEVRDATATVDPATAGRVRVTAPAARATSRARDARPAVPEGWSGVRAVRIDDDEAVLRFPDGERTLVPGDRLGDALVREIGDRVVVLDREAVPGRPGGAALVIVRFDAAGQPQVRTVHEEDPTRVAPPEVR